MPYLDTYQQTLTAENAAHLLRRATFGPTKQEITSFTGLTAVEAVNRLISNVSITTSPPPPVDFDETTPTAGKPFLSLPLDKAKASTFSMYIRYWWLGLMLEQNGNPSVLEKLTAFWQNHFVVTQSAVPDYRVSDRYLRTLRNNCLGSFRSLAVMMTKDAGMLIFQNGNENQKGRPNENYARELQELFVVGAKNFYGNPNYTEDDVKAASKVLTGWQVKNYWTDGATSFEVTYDPNRHDTSDKSFSSYYGNNIITGRAGATSGESELGELVNMLLSHPESPKFICRKLYRWYVNTDVSQEIEDNVITPLAQFFASASNDFKIEPVLRKLLTSEIFYDSRNRGALIKSPLEWIVGNLRFFNQPLPNITTDYIAFRNYVQFAYSHLTSLQYLLLVQPTVFGYVPYYQTGYSENWINGTSVGRRHFIVDRLIYPAVEIKPGYIIGLDLVAWITAQQKNFSDVAGTQAITCEQVLESFTEHLFAVNLSQIDKDFLIDTIMMRGVSRTTWIKEWNSYRSDPGNTDRKKAVQFRFTILMRHLMRMAEYQIF
jgi:uncharacterized protein (DUF1800 family)